MELEGTRRVLDTTSEETANQYLRFGWLLVNQYVLEATEERQAEIHFVLASVRRLEDTRVLLMLSDPEHVNEHLNLGWRLIDKHVTSDENAASRHETIHFVLAWQSEDPPVRPGDVPPVVRQRNTRVASDDLL